ncbi:hypothetical protein IKD56_02090 [bacterium]|nr:hypothetical protein [bacterium]
MVSLLLVLVLPIEKKSGMFFIISSICDGSKLSNIDLKVLPKMLLACCLILMYWVIISEIKSSNVGLLSALINLIDSL